jgi:hypothetical protein
MRFVVQQSVILKVFSFPCTTLEHSYRGAGAVLRKMATFTDPEKGYVFKLNDTQQQVFNGGLLLMGSRPQ